MQFRSKQSLVAILAFGFTTASSPGSQQIILAPSTGGFLADDNGDGVYDRALPGLGFGVGKANQFSNVGSRQYQGAYEWDLLAPAIAQLSQNQILSVTLTFSRNTYGANSTAPNLQGIAAGYVGDGSFNFGDVGLGSSVATYPIWNHFRVSLPQADPVLDVTGFFLSTRGAGNEFLGFNLRTDDPLPPGTTVDNFFTSPSW